MVYNPNLTMNYYYKTELSVLDSRDTQGFMDGLESNEWIYFEIL